MRKKEEAEAVRTLCAQSCWWGTEKGHHVASGDTQRCPDKHPPAGTTRDTVSSAGSEEKPSKFSCPSQVIPRLSTRTQRCSPRCSVPALTTARRGESPRSTCPKAEEGLRTRAAKSRPGLAALTRRPCHPASAPSSPTQRGPRSCLRRGRASYRYKATKALEEGNAIPTATAAMPLYHGATGFLTRALL